jgi:hypothetical protein
MDAQKGVLEVLTMAHRLEKLWPGRFHWHVVGGGPVVAQFQLQLETMELDSVVSYHGEQFPDRLLEVINMTHATIVPTRSAFAEGLAKTAVESVLSGRPVITNRVVPALEVLRPACLEAEPDDIESYMELILNLSEDRDKYRQLCWACSDLQLQFFEGKFRMRQILQNVITAQPDRLPQRTSRGLRHRPADQELLSGWRNRRQQVLYESVLKRERLSPEHTDC